MGEIIADPARGYWLGNRGGRFHNPAGKTLGTRRWASRAWICCKLEFNNRQRAEIMGPGYTELFFMDEVTALAAGHRPCFECRRQDARHFLELHAAATGAAKRLPAGEFDKLAQHDRLTGRTKKTYRARLADLPFGTMMLVDDQIYALHETGLLAWSITGYGPDVRPADESLSVEVLTPQVFVTVLQQGYAPQWHHTAA